MYFTLNSLSLLSISSEVVSLLVMVGKRGGLTREVYREHYGEADELAAMISSTMSHSIANTLHD
jgi:hypothetical protein